MSLHDHVKNCSIKTRLAFFFMVTACAIFFSAYVLIHSTLHASLSREENDFIYDRFHTLRAIIQANADHLEIIRRSIEWEGKYTAFPEYYLRILDHSGHSLLQTPGMDMVIPSDWVPQLSRFEDHDLIRRAENGRYFLLKGDHVDDPFGGQRPLFLQLALDVTSEVTIDEANHKKIISLLVVGIVIVGGIGVVIIHQLLRPLEKMVEFAEGITFQRISHRTDPRRLPKEVKALAVSFNIMLDRLQESVTRLSHCASNMAHEIRTPINNLMGEAEVALLQERTPAEYQKVLESAIEECGRLSRLVSNLLFLARAENPSACVEHSEFDAAKELQDICSLYTPQAEEKGARLSLSGGAVLNADPLLFRRAISNLLTNALYYSPPGATVDISISETLEEKVEISVSDTGFGISAKDLPRIFDRFYRGDFSRSNYSEGSGLGLSIVKAIMDLHGGTVTIDSIEGEGTTITLDFPKRQPKEV